MDNGYSAENIIDAKTQTQLVVALMPYRMPLVSNFDT